MPGSLSWARMAADLASLSGAVSTRQGSKHRAWRGEEGEGGRGGVGIRGGHLTWTAAKKRASVAGKRSPMLAHSMSWETRKRRSEVSSTEDDERKKKTAEDPKLLKMCCEAGPLLKIGTNMIIYWKHNRTNYKQDDDIAENLQQPHS